MTSSPPNTFTVSDSSSSDVPYYSPGMPALDMSGKQTSFYEFWPTWVIYFPVLLQSLCLAVRYRSLTLPLIANPKLPLSGMVGVEKSRLLAQAQGECQQAILPWFLHTRSNEDLQSQVASIDTQLLERGFKYPVVCKPDIGCRGSGVKLVHSQQQLLNALSCYPEGAGMLVQRLSSWEPEAGVFYLRAPSEAQGKIISLALKYTPYVVGDGSSTLRQLIEADPRASQLGHLYFKRHQQSLDKVLPDGTPFKLVFSASHCRGAIFRDAQTHITPKLSARIDSLMKDIPEFYYGRLDIKFRDMDSLKCGEHIEIVEINSASSESLHIWDRNTSLAEAMRSLLFQYRSLFKLGAQNRNQGYQPPRLATLLKAWRKERSLTKHYPETD